ncbi:hypothetical protein L9F63_011108 [Diploptera punctata]|uniref:Phosphoglucomutase-2 n=1 Tax=Diploptera punctata TaxID=6984 RepID=A0AAD8AFS9_DIPPU|nr:hypothetical protein L9F63_011108 [Diploptera punctata]
MCNYMKIIQRDTLNLEMNAACDIKFTYTAMHGVGYSFMIQAFRAANFKPFIVVEEQKDPDPEFSTVKFPNPEEGKSALNLAIETADKNSSTVILANDPDADRMAVAEKQSDGEQGWHIFNGNELGSLLGWWCWHSYRERNPGEDLNNLYMMSSTVSSKLIKTMASIEGFQFFETLTGFKWMGNKTAELQKEGKKVIFAFEEAIGFMCFTAVLDKDGISAAVRAAEMVSYLSTKGMTLMDKLQDLYSTYGFHISNNSYFLCYEQPVIEHIFERLRNFSGSADTYPTSLLDGKYEIETVRDLTTGFDSSQPDNKAVLPVSKSNQMITFTFKNGLVATLRTSGTEPKVKYYTELCASPAEKNVEVVKATLEEMVAAIVEEFLQPEENGLIARSN